MLQAGETSKPGDVPGSPDLRPQPCFAVGTIQGSAVVNSSMHQHISMTGVEVMLTCRFSKLSICWLRIWKVMGWLPKEGCLMEFTALI